MRTKKASFFNSIIVGLCVLTLLVTSAVVFSACGTMYSSVAGKMEDMTGTYQLTTFKQKDDGVEVDRITQLNVKAYMVVGADGNGYYAYQDNNTEFWYDSTLIKYTKDLQKPELYKAIQMTVGKNDTRISYQKPGYGYEPPMGFNVNTKTFNYSIPDDQPTQSWLYPSYYTSVVYTKISDKTDLSTISAKTGRNLTPLAKYEIKSLNGALIFHAGIPNHEIAPTVNNPQYNIYKYYVVDFDAVNEKANIYYELIEGSAGAQVENNVAVEVNVTKTTDEYNNSIVHVAIKFFGEYYDAYVSFTSTPPIYLNHAVFTEPDEYGSSYEIYNNNFAKYSGSKTTIDEIVAEQLEAYNNSLT